MANRFDTTMRESTDLFETGLRLLDGMLEGMRPARPETTGARPDEVDASLPRTISGSVAELGNRVARTVGMSRPTELVSNWSEITTHARDSFAASGTPSGVSGTAETVRASLSLAVQQALRMNASYHTAPRDAFESFVREVAEVMEDSHVFATLQYREVIAHHRARLQKSNDDHGARLALAHTLTKCGLYEEAVHELETAATDAAWRPRALHELAVASYRAGRFTACAQYAVEALTLEPDDKRTKLLLWLAAERLGGYAGNVPASMRMQVRSGRGQTHLHFEDISSRVGLDKTSGGRGTAVFDYNGDGYLDILVAAAHGGCTLFRNNGDGTFTDVSIASGLDQCQTTFVVTVGDYDNDGHPDVFITRNGFFGGQCSLLHNNGDGTFTDVTAEAGLEGWGPAFTAAFVDYDNDGRLDLFVVHNLGSLFEQKTPNRLFHNNGDGTFTDVTATAGIVTDSPTIGCCWGDYDNDGRPDLFVSNSIGRSQLFHNNGDGTFTDVSRESGLDMYGLGSVCYWVDVDNDGWLDLVQQVWSDAEDVIHTLQHGEGPPASQPSRIWRNNRDGSFSLVSRELGLTGCWGSMSGNAADLSNNGHMDLVLGNGSPRMERVEPLTLMQNDGRRLHDVTFSAGLPVVGKSHGVNLADLFGDGRMTVLVASGGAYPGDLMTVGAYCPTERTGNYMNVRLEGTKSNRSAIGARLSLTAGGRTQHRLVSGGSQFGCLPFEQHFGLGDLTQVDRIDIWWPSGLRQHVAGPLSANATIRIAEGQPEVIDVYGARGRQ